MDEAAVVEIVAIESGVGSGVVVVDSVALFVVNGVLFLVSAGLVVASVVVVVDGVIMVVLSAFVTRDVAVVSSLTDAAVAAVVVDELVVVEVVVVVPVVGSGVSLADSVAVVAVD